MDLSLRLTVTQGESPMPKGLWQVNRELESQLHAAKAELHDVMMTLAIIPTTNLVLALVLAVGLDES